LYNFLQQPSKVQQPIGWSGEGGGDRPFLSSL